MGGPGDQRVSPMGSPGTCATWGSRRDRVAVRGFDLRLSRPGPGIEAPPFGADVRSWERLPGVGVSVTFTPHLPVWSSSCRWTGSCQHGLACEMSVVSYQPWGFMAPPPPWHRGGQGEGVPPASGAPPRVPTQFREPGTPSSPRRGFPSERLGLGAASTRQWFVSTEQLANYFQKY